MIKYIITILILLESCSQSTNNESGNDYIDTPLAINNHMQPDNLGTGNIDSSFLQFWEKFKLIAQTRDIVSFREVSLDTLNTNGLLIDKHELKKIDFSDIFNIKLMENWDNNKNISIFYGDQDISLSSFIIQKSADNVSNPFIEVAISGTSFNDYKGKINLDFLKTKTGYKLIGYLTGPR